MIDVVKHEKHLLLIKQGFFVNNISGYAKFPMTCFLDVYQKNFFLPEIFSGYLF